MKKSLKIALASLALVPCAALFAGCGQDQLTTQANVNTTANYQASSKEQFTTYATGTDTSTRLSGYRFTMEAKAKTSLNGQSSESDVLLNGIIKTSDTGVEAAFKMTMAGQDIMKAYIKDGYAYADISVFGEKEKIKFQVDTKDIFNGLEEISGNVAPTSISSVQEILDFINNATDLNVEAAVEGTINKYHFSADSTNISAMLDAASTILGRDFNCYFVFDSNILTGAQISFKYAMDVALGSVDVDAKISMEKYDESIKFPSLNGYKETIL